MLPSPRTCPTPGRLILSRCPKESSYHWCMHLVNSLFLCLVPRMERWRQNRVNCCTDIAMESNCSTQHRHPCTPRVTPSHLVLLGVLFGHKRQRTRYYLVQYYCCTAVEFLYDYFIGNSLLSVSIMSPTVLSLESSTTTVEYFST